MMQHLAEETINDLLDARLSEMLEREAHSHLQECVECMGAMNAIAAVIAAAPEARIVASPLYDLWPAIADHAGIQRRRRRPWIVVLLVIIAIAAATLFLVSRQSREPSGNTALSPANARIRLGQAIATESDHYKATKLIALVDYARKDPRFTAEILESAKAISSSNDKLSVLIALADADAISTEALTALYLDVARSITSTTGLPRAIDALTRQK
ncbi:MAG TPA: hypothetical protein VF042_08710 [Gemmatimonadaceae bacterium]